MTHLNDMSLNDLRFPRSIPPLLGCVTIRQSYVTTSSRVWPFAVMGHDTASLNRFCHYVKFFRFTVAFWRCRSCPVGNAFLVCCRVTGLNAVLLRTFRFPATTRVRRNTPSFLCVAIRLRPVTKICYVWSFLCVFLKPPPIGFPAVWIVRMRRCSICQCCAIC